MTLRKQLLLQTSDPLLDAQVTADGALLALAPARIAIYRESAGAWQQAQTFAIAPALAASLRDPRGELTANSGSLTAFLPGTQCDATAGLNFTCRASDDPWPMGTQKAFYNASRNYFSGVLVPATTVALPPFYSAAEVPGPSGLVTIFADIHGHARILDRGALVDLPGSRDWGSDLAAIGSGCGTGTQLLVDSAGGPSHDSLRAYEIDGHEAHAVSAPLDLDGTVTALHTTSDDTAANAVVHNSNRYEVWRVALDCR